MNDIPQWRVAIGAVVMLLVRACLLLALVPFCLLTWPVASVIAGAPLVTLGQWLGWVDWNAIACMQRMLRPFVQEIFEWSSWRDIRTVDHRVGIFLW